MTYDTRLRLLEAQVKDLRGKLPQTPTQEAAWRCWQLEREERLVAEHALRDFARTAESIACELEALVWFLRGHKEA